MAAVLNTIKTLNVAPMKAIRMRVQNADLYVSQLEADGVITTTDNGRTWSVK